MSETRTGSETGTMIEIETLETVSGIVDQDMNERTVAFWTTVTETGIGTEIGTGTDRGRGSEGVASSLLALVSLRLLVLYPLLPLPLPLPLLLLRHLLLPLLL